jgi:hypothetical protein
MNVQAEADGLKGPNSCEVGRAEDSLPVAAHLRRQNIVLSDTSDDDNEPQEEESQSYLLLAGDDLLSIIVAGVRVVHITNRRPLRHPLIRRRCVPNRGRGCEGGGPPAMHLQGHLLACELHRSHED